MLMCLSRSISYWAPTRKDRFCSLRVTETWMLNCRSFIIRVNLADPAKNVLIECKFEVIYRCILTTAGQRSPFITHIPLKLVRAEVSYLRFGLIIRHVIDETSPLYGMDFKVWSKSTHCLFTSRAVVIQEQDVVCCGEPVRVLMN